MKLNLHLGVGSIRKSGRHTENVWGGTLEKSRQKTMTMRANNAGLNMAGESPHLPHRESWQVDLFWL